MWLDRAERKVSKQDNTHTDGLYFGYYQQFEAVSNMQEIRCD